jgi:hypothetical protein
MNNWRELTLGSIITVCAAVVLCFVIVHISGCERERNEKKAETIKHIIEQNQDTGVIIIDDQRMP